MGTALNGSDLPSHRHRSVEGRVARINVNRLNDTFIRDEINAVSVRDMQRDDEPFGLATRSRSADRDAITELAGRPSVPSMGMGRTSRRVFPAFLP